MRSPFGRVQSASTPPTGSGSAAISSRPCATAATRASSSISRSTNDEGRPAALAAATSLAFAASTVAVWRRKASAAARRAAFLASVGASASSRAALLEASPTATISSAVSMVFKASTCSTPCRPGGRAPVRPRSRGSWRSRPTCAQGCARRRSERRPRDRDQARVRPGPG